MDTLEFYNSIENSLLDEKKIDERKVYLQSLNELYPDIHSYRNPKVLKHYKILKDKEPQVPSLDEYISSYRAKIKKYNLKADYGDDFLEELYNIKKPRKALALSSRDIKIANILKLQSKGVMICLSPKADYYPSIETFMDKVKNTRCKQVESAKYYFEIHTKDPENPTLRMHAHMYVKMKDYSYKSKNNLRSYFKSRYPYMIITSNPNKSALVHKLDITYGWSCYLKGLGSTSKKASLKSMDYKWREDNNIPHILTL